MSKCFSKSLWPGETQLGYNIRIQSGCRFSCEHHHVMQILQLGGGRLERAVSPLIIQSALPNYRVSFIIAACYILVCKLLGQFTVRQIFRLLPQHSLAWLKTYFAFSWASQTESFRSQLVKRIKVIGIGNSFFY